MMRILFSGTSSFTGYWFIRALTDAGHQVTALLQKRREAYEGVRKERIDRLEPFVTLVEACPFGSAPFLLALDDGPWDLYCHHGAEVRNYKSPSFDPVAALKNNVLDLNPLKERGCEKILLTGSVFEPGEGAGSDGLRAVSPYGLSKGLTSDFFRYYCDREKILLGKFVIPNPFGPLEEFRYPSFVAQRWLAGEAVRVTHPRNVRDNIPVSLLAHAYRQAAETLTLPYQAWNPSFYIDSGEAFTARLAKELGSRWNTPCPYQIQEQTDFSEPLVRINTQPIDPALFGWDEAAFWDSLAETYQSSKQEAFR